jgi:calcium-dependent protein kinase
MKCDIWSLGVILYVLLSDVPPFNGRSDEEISDNIRKGEYSLTSKEWETVSQEAKELVQKLLVLDPAYRISLADAMVDPWITSHKIDRSREIPAASEVLASLKRFRGDLKLRQALSAYAVSHFSSKEEINRQKELFKALDKDNSGMLTRSELIEGLSTQMSLSDAESEVTRIMENLDMNHTGSVDYSEFVTSAAFAQNAVTVAQLKNAFQSLDLDHSGKLSCAELKGLLGRGVTGAEDWVKLVAQADTDGDGEISLSEFISFLLNE